MPYPWSAGNVLTATDLNSSLAAKTDLAMTQNAQTGTTYSFALADASKLLTTSNASPVSVTVTKQATVTWVTGTQLRVLNLGAGVTTLVADTGVTINNNKALAQYQGGTLIRTASDAWTFQPNAATSKVLQVVAATYGTTTLTTSSSYVDTGLTATITPSSATSKIYVALSQSFTKENDSAVSAVYAQLVRNGTSVIIFAAAALGTNPNALNANEWCSTNFLDSPATTSAVTYKTQFRNGTAGLNTRAQHSGDTSTIILMEISA